MKVAQLEKHQIRALDIFKGMSGSGFDRLIVGATCQTFPAHIELVVAGDRPDFLYVVLEGLIELYAGDDKRESMTGLVGPVNMLMLDAVVTDAPFLMSARTCQRSRLLMLPAAHVRQAIDYDPRFARIVIGELAMDYRSVDKEFKNLRLRTAAERLANRLLVLDARANNPEQFTLPYDKRILAGQLAMTPENLSRAFAALRKHGVKVDGASIALTDRQALNEFARPDPLIDDLVL